jgi:hypothetical protein
VALIEMDESWEEWDQQEESRLAEMFPLIEKPFVKAQVSSWDRGVSKKKGTPQIEWELTIVDDDQYTGKTLTYRTPTVGRGKFVTKAFMDACRVKRQGNSIDPDLCMGKILGINLSVVTTDQGRKFTNIDSVVAI